MDDQIKTDTIRKIVSMCRDFVTPEQLKRIESAATVALYGLQISKEETALSADFAKPNDWYIKQFLAIKMVKGLSAKSIKFYGTTINLFFRIVDKAVPEITANDVRYYLAVRGQTGIKKTTADNELRNLKTFFETLTAEGLIARNPTKGVNAIKKDKTLKKPFTEYEMEQIRKAASASKDGKRNLAIVEILYSTGCRVSEMEGMNREDVKDDRIVVTGKGNKQRWVYLNTRAKVALEDYLMTRNDDNPALICGRAGRLGKSGVEGIVRDLGKAAGVEDCHPHRFRRTAATTALRHGMPIEQVSRMLGHESLETTQIYAITEDSDVQAAHQKYLT